MNDKECCKRWRALQKFYEKELARLQKIEKALKNWNKSLDMYNRFSGLQISDNIDLVLGGKNAN